MRRRLWLVVAALVAVLPSAARADSCSPFGNPPMPVVPEAFGDQSVPSCTNGERLGPWTDADGNARYACLYVPPSADALALPLVVYIHPSLFNADTLGTATNILEYQQSANLSDDPARPGFIVLAPNGRSTPHFYPSPDEKGIGWDNWYRQLDPSGGAVTVGDVVYPQNVDAASIDHWIDVVRSTHPVDEDRIYATGWSNGAAMAELYGLMRPSIAAIAVYSAPDPFAAFNDPCKQIPVRGAPATTAEIRFFNRGLPTMHVHNDCDIVGLCPNGERLSRRLLAQGIGVQDTIVNTAMLPANGCLAECGTNEDANFDAMASLPGVTVGTVNHLRWPIGWTVPMLDFFRVHPRSARPAAE
jgi:poly(3-hydroxybutyrate) depolymerase